MGNIILLYSSLLYTKLFYCLRKALVFEKVPVVFI